MGRLGADCIFYHHAPFFTNHEQVCLAKGPQESRLAAGGIQGMDEHLFSINRMSP